MATSQGFNPRAPCGARPPIHPMRSAGTSFNPRAPCGARRQRGHLQGVDCRFNPRAPCGARLNPYHAHDSPVKFQSTRPVRGATAVLVELAFIDNVSIHAPRAGRDPLLILCISFSRVSIHAPRAGRDPRCCGTSDRDTCFNPRAPCGARLLVARWAVFYVGFNPRAPCGARPITAAIFADNTLFQSTRPVRGATPTLTFPDNHCHVSIHAPRAGRDGDVQRRRVVTACFNPRAPCGARLTLPRLRQYRP